ncbi:Dihydroxyacetone kinase 2 [Sporothrix curviconia]|uniref:Dihydroxyacetone kinase 2 n=1 Tax=Sporothrix curviconia TaxID=1260050 RepID=A0ABP0CWD9_9PEZI
MSLGKHFINGITDPITRALRVALLQDPSLRLITDDKVLYRDDGRSDKVRIVAGGGSGHEPAYAGYLGEGMLDVAVAGQIFASPSASQISAGLHAATTDKGFLMVVKNYTGDKLNFGLAAEKVKADGKHVNIVFVNDDASVEGNALVGQRGLAGVVPVLKVAGALAAKGASLEDVTRVASKTATSLVTVSASLDRCSVPNRGKQDGLPFDELEYGMGIHNEPGTQRAKVVFLDKTVEHLLAMIFRQPTETSNWRPAPGHTVGVIINNLGGLSVLELNVVADEILQQLKSRHTDIHVVRLMVGTFLTSLDGPGFSITMLRLDDPEILSLLDEPTTAPAWPHRIINISGDHLPLKAQTVAPKLPSHEAVSQVDETAYETAALGKLLDGIDATTRADEPLITKYDTIAGDGDCGETLLNGVQALLRGFDEYSAKTILPSQAFRLAATAAERGMGGTSGALYAIFLNAVSNALRTPTINTSAHGKGVSDSALPAICNALDAGLGELCKYTLARKGHRTLMDALIPFVETLQLTGRLTDAYASAQAGAESTRHMHAAMGRASYVGSDVFEQHGGIPDPGALGVTSVIRGVVEALGLTVAVTK